MAREAPPVVKLSQRVLAAVEIAVTRFPRKHRFRCGDDLRDDARTSARCAAKAWRDFDRRLERLEQLADAIDDLKLSLQLSKDVEAFRSFAEFEVLARLVNDLGRQCGGWQKTERRKGQSRQAVPPDGRAPILSARDASAEAHP